MLAVHYSEAGNIRLVILQQILALNEVWDATDWLESVVA